MSVLEIERSNGIMVLRMNRPERLNALNAELRKALREAWIEFDESADLEVAIYTGTGRAFCAGGDLNELVEIGPDGDYPSYRDNPFDEGTLRKPVIAAINGLAMGAAFALVEQTHLRVAARSAIFEASEAKRWLLGGYSHGLVGNLPHAIATELAFAFRFDAQRLYELGFINRIVETDEVMPTAYAMAEHLMTLAPASRVNTLVMMNEMRPAVSPEIAELAERLHHHGAKADIQESRAAFTEKRSPNFIGWTEDGDRANTPSLASIRAERKAP